MNTHKYESKLIILVGNIGSGKSTYTKKYSKDYVTLSPDAMRYMMGNGEYIFDPVLEPWLLGSLSHLYRDLVITGVNILIDSTNIKRSLREMYVEVAKKCNYHITCIEMPRLSKEESVARRLHDPHGSDDADIWGKVWEIMDSNYNEPLSDEGYDELIKLQ